MPSSKICSGCGEDKLLHKFYKWGTRCKKCESARANEWRRNNLDRVAQNARAWRKNNPDKFKAHCKKYNDKHKEARRIREKERYYERREAVLKQKKEYYKQNKDKIHALCAKYRARKLNATPNWVDDDKLREIYKNCPSGYHVDHIIPLQGKNVRGLHVPWNLQYLPAHENISKGNRYG